MQYIPSLHRLFLPTHCLKDGNATGLAMLPCTRLSRHKYPSEGSCCCLAHVQCLVMPSCNCCESESQSMYMKSCWSCLRLYRLLPFTLRSLGISRTPKTLTASACSVAIRGIFPQNAPDHERKDHFSPRSFSRCDKSPSFCGVCGLEGDGLPA